MNLLSRTSRNPIAKWWWTVDRQMVIGVMVLLGMGFFAAFAASPAVAQHIGKSTYYFANKQLVFLVLAAFVFLTVSMLDAIWIRRFAVLMLVGAIGTGSLPGCRGSPDSIKLDFNPASTYAVVRLTDLLKASKV